MPRFEEHEIEEMWDVTIERWENIAKGKFEDFENKECVFCDNFYCFNIGEKRYPVDGDVCPISNIKYTCNSLGYDEFKEAYAKYDVKDGSEEEVKAAARVFCDNLKLIRKGEYKHDYK
jgi:hypothetical protein